MSTDNENKNSKEIADNNERAAEATEDQQKAAEKLLETLSKNKKESQEHYEILLQSAQALGDAHEADKARFELNKQIVEEQLRQQDIARLGSQEAADTDEARKERQEAILAIMRGQGDALNYNVTQSQKQLRTDYMIQEGQRKYGKEQKKVLGDLAKGIGINVQYSQTFFGNMRSVADAIAKGGDEGREAALAFKRNFDQLFSWQNIAASTFMKIFEMTASLVKQFDDATASLGVATTMAGKFDDALFSAQRQVNLSGVSMKDAADAVGTLNAQTSNFIKASKSTQVEMIKTTSMLAKLGVDGQTAAETFQFLNLNLGMTEKQALNAQKQLALMGRQLGKNAQEMTKEFNQSLKILAVYGDQAVDVFSNLAAAAKASGVETSKLLGLVKQFDTFAGAAEGVGKLNALLGTQLSTTQMMMMTEDERLETLISTVQAQGIAFKDMDKFTQMAIASAAGIDDMNEAQKIFGMNLSDYQENKDLMDKQAASQAKFQEAVDGTIPVFIKFKNLATELVVAVQPALEWLAGWAEDLTKWLRKLTVGQREFVVGVTALVTGIALLGVTMMPLLGALKMYRSAMAVLEGIQAADIVQKAVQTKAATTQAGANELLAASNVQVGTTSKVAGKGLAALAHPKVALGILVVVAAIAAVIGMLALYQAQKAKIAEAEAREQEARAKQIAGLNQLGASFRALTDTDYDMVVGGITKSFEALTNTDFSGMLENVKSAVEELQGLGTNEPVMIKTRSTLENLALISVGRAKDSMTGNIISATKIDMNANISNVFKNMTLVVDIGGEKFDAKVRDIATDVATEVAGGTE